MKIPRAGALVAAALILVSCGAIRKPARPVHRFLPDYPAPAAQDGPKLAAGLAVEGFSTARGFDSRAMVFRKPSGEWSEYPYNRWRARPGEMVSDYLARDLAARGRFALAAWPELDARARFRLSGIVLEFFEDDRPDGWEAVLSVDVVLMDSRAQSLPEKVLFQKNVNAAFPAKERSAEAVARAMGQCVEEVSRRVEAEAFQAVAARLASPSREEQP